RRATPDPEALQSAHGTNVILLTHPIIRRQLDGGTYPFTTSYGEGPILSLRTFCPLLATTRSVAVEFRTIESLAKQGWEPEVVDTRCDRYRMRARSEPTGITIAAGPLHTPMVSAS